MEARYVKTHRSRDLKKSILFVSKNILEPLAKCSEMKLNEVFLRVQKRIGIKEKDFMFALNFLFVLGAIAYDKKRDVLVCKT